LVTLDDLKGKKWEMVGEFQNEEGVVAYNGRHLKRYCIIRDSDSNREEVVGLTLGYNLVKKSAPKSSRGQEFDGFYNVFADV